MIRKEERIGGQRLILGDCLEVMAELDPVDGILTDPPYSSGGSFRGDRTQKVASKYVQTSSAITCRADFAGDTRDQRAFLAWASMVFSRAYYLTKPGGACLAFTDWRQLPTMTDAMQCGGWVWRNIVTWWKPGIRMQRGRFSSSAEYVIYGTKGLPTPGQKSPQNVLQCAPVGGEDKSHIAEKPHNLIAELLGVTPEGATVLDPFMGSASTLIACMKSGRRGIGIEVDPEGFENACRRVDEATRQPDFLIDPPQIQPHQMGMFDAENR
jgi:site-specific DNA-methyltransferase (adenine-specific)